MNSKFLFLCEILGKHLYIIPPDQRSNEPKTFKSIKQKYKDIHEKNREDYLKNLEKYQRRINGKKRN